MVGVILIFNYLAHGSDLYAEIILRKAVCPVNDFTGAFFRILIDLIDHEVDSVLCDKCFDIVHISSVLLF